MHLKTYFVESVEEAMLRARAELGDDALFVHSKRTAGEQAHLGRYEVVFAAAAGVAAAPDRPAEPEALALVPRPAPAPAPARPAPEPSVARELRQLAARMDAPPAEEFSGPQEIRRSIDELFCYLSEREVDGRHGQALTQAVGIELTRRRIRQEAGRAFDLLRRELAAGVTAAAAPAPGGLRMIALVGPAGAGKTTAIAKLAIHEGLARQVPTQILDYDTHRIGGTALQPIADLLGIPAERAATADPLRAIVSHARRPRLVLIDTPGYLPGETEELERLAAELAPFATLERHLVLPAPLRYREMTRRLQQYRAFAPTHLLFTRIDEALTFGPAWSLARESRLPLSWFGNGARLPAALDPASAEALAELVFDSSPAEPAAASPARALSAVAAGSPPAPIRNFEASA